MASDVNICVSNVNMGTKNNDKKHNWAQCILLMKKKQIYKIYRQCIDMTVNYISWAIARWYFHQYIGNICVNAQIYHALNDCEKK